MPAPPFIAPCEEPRTYTGVCHCKANKFTIKLPKLTAGMMCTCSICSVHNVMWTFLPPNSEDIQFEREGPQIEYAWNKKMYLFNFCATCGVFLKASLPSTGDLAVNLRTLQDVDLWSYKSDPLYDGANLLGPPYKAPVFTGPPFAGDPTGKTEVYYGSCHCGKCTIALRTKPLSEVEINECNCSLCWRYSRVNMYPSSDQLHVGGVENLKIYKTNELGGGLFCNTCGVTLFDADEDGAHDGNGMKIDSAKEKLGHDLRICAVNVRTLRGVDWENLKVNKYDGRSKDPQFIAE